MGCSNCYNGCADIISDQCVKYTGINIPGLGITTGDPLLVVENKITEKLLQVMIGAGIVPTIAPADLCSIISGYLPVSGTITLNHVLSALFKSICNINTRLIVTEDKLTALNADYVVDCLSGVGPASDTHEVVQAIITKLCSVDDGLIALSAELQSNYVLISEIDSYIASYLSSIPATTLHNAKMIPYVAVPFFGAITGNFDATGAGIGSWEKIYLCNGQNFTPDLRGRTLVGATTMGNTAFNPTVDPGIAGNPAYALNTLAGANQGFITSVGQIPSHTHAATVTINEIPHTHTYEGKVVNTRSQEGSNGHYAVDFGPFTTSPSSTGLKGNGNDPINPNVIVTIGETGGSSVAGHNNIQPSIGVNYIIYIP